MSMALFKCKMRHFALMLKWGVQQSSNSGNQDVLVQLALLWNTLFLTGLNNILKNITLFENKQEIEAIDIFSFWKIDHSTKCPRQLKEKLEHPVLLSKTKQIAKRTEIKQPWELYWWRLPLSFNASSCPDLLLDKIREGGVAISNAAIGERTQRSRLSTTLQRKLPSGMTFRTVLRVCRLHFIMHFSLRA